MGYERAISDIEESQSDVKSFKSDVRSKQKKVKQFQEGISQREKQVKGQRYTSSRAEQLYGSKELEALKKKKKQAQQDLQELKEGEKKAAEALESLAEQKQTIQEYKDKGYKIKETEDGYTFSKKMKSGGSKSRSLSKKEWAGLKDWRPDSLKGKISESAFENALWKIHKGTDSVTTDGFKFYETDKGEVAFSEGYDVDYVGVNPDWKRTNKRIEKLESMREGLRDWDKVKNPAYSRITNKIGDTLGDIRDVFRDGVQPGDLEKVRNYQKRLVSLKGKLDNTPKYKKVRYTPHEKVLDNVFSHRLSRYQDAIQNIPKEKQMTKTVYPEQGESIYDKIPGTAVQVKNPEFKEFNINKNLPFQSKNIQRISEVIESKINKGVPERIPLVTGWESLATKKSEDKKVTETKTKQFDTPSLPDEGLDFQETSPLSGVDIEAADEFVQSEPSAGMTAAPGNIPGSTAYKVKQFNQPGVVGSPGSQDEGLTLKQLEPSINRTTGVFAGLTGGTAPGKETVQEKKQHFIFHDEENKPVYLKETKPSLYFDYTPKDTDALKILGQLKGTKQDYLQNISTAESNISQLQSYLEDVKQSDRKTVWYDVDQDDELESVSKQKAVSAIQSDIQSQQETLSELQSGKSKVIEQIGAVGKVQELGYRVKQTEGGGWKILRPSTEKVFSAVTGSKKIGVSDYIIQGDFGIQPVAASWVSLATGDKKYFEATQEDIMKKRLSSEYNVKRTEGAGGSGSFAHVMNIGGSPAAQTVGVTALTLGAGWFVGAGAKTTQLALKGTKIGGKLTRLGIKSGKHAIKIGKYTVTPGKAVVYGGVGALEAAHISKTVDEQGYKAPGKLGSHFLRMGLGWKAFGSGMKKGYGKPLRTSQKDVSITDLRTESRIKKLKSTFAESKDYMWARHPKITGNLKAAVGRAKDVGRQTAYTFKTGGRQFAKASKSGYGYLKSKSSVVSTLDEGLRADIQTIKSSSKLKGLKQAFSKKSPQIKTMFPDDELQTWQKLEGKQGQFRDLNKQLVLSDDTQILAQRLYRGKGLESDVYQFRFKSPLSVTDDLASGLRVSKGMKASGRGLAFVEKEPVLFKTSTGKYQMFFRPSGKSVSFGTSTVKSPDVGRFMKTSQTKVFGFKGMSVKQRTPGLQVMDEPNQFFRFKTVAETQYRGADTSIRNIGIGKYTPADDAFASLRTTPRTWQTAAKTKNLVLQSKQLNFADELVSLKKGMGGKVEMVGAYSPPKGFEKAMYKIKGSMVTLPEESKDLIAYSASKIKPYNPKSFIQNVEASGILTRQAERSVEASVLAGIGDVGGQAAVSPVSVTLPQTGFAAGKASVRQLSLGGVGGAIAGFEPGVEQKSRRDMKVKRSLLPQQVTSLRKQYKQQGMSQERGLSVDTGKVFDVGRDTKRSVDVAPGFDVSQSMMQKQQLNLKMKLDIDMSAPSDLSPPMIGGLTISAPSPPKPVPPVIPQSGFGRRRGVMQFDKQDFNFGKKQPLKPLTRKKVLANPFRVMESQQKYGKATHPTVKGDVVQFGKRYGWDIPTMELMQEKKEKKRKKIDFGFNKDDWSIEL